MRISLEFNVLLELLNIQINFYMTNSFFRFWLKKFYLIKTAENVILNVDFIKIFKKMICFFEYY